ncbi:MAG: phosphotransferase, partial [Candidatus Sungbacteria bacterium]|nr:phosphotransferase [Candidatus Sungbacteria bacterium]
MADPTHYRAGEWLYAEQEYALLDALGNTQLAPQPHMMISSRPPFIHPPFVMMEWIEGTALNALKEARDEYLDAVARAIGLLCRQTDITPERFRFIPRVSGWRESGNVTRYVRLLDACRRMSRRDVAIAVWAARILPVVMRVHHILWKYRGVFKDAPWCFHHDGLHAGNVFIRPDGSVVFLDWDKVSYRKNPVFTLARFASSLYPYGRMPAEVFLRLAEVFSEKFEGYDFHRMHYMGVYSLL